jgi:predicted tellurium resistance membrane protein TerC
MDLLYSELVALLQIVVIDVVLAGDNAIVVGMAASRVAPEMRAKVIFWGIAGAVLLRIGFAAVTVQLLAIVGLTLAGGILLLWVCWKMYRELRHEPRAASPAPPSPAATPTPAGSWASGARSCRSSSPTCPCRSTTCWPWPAPPRATPAC